METDNDRDTDHPFMPQMAVCGKGGRQKKGAAGVAAPSSPGGSRGVPRVHFFSARMTFPSSAVLNTTVILLPEGLP